MDPIGSSTSGAVRVPPPAPAPVAEQLAAPLPSAPLAPASRLADRPVATREPEPPPLPIGLQRESMRPPEPPVMSREQMVALLDAAVGGGVPVPPPTRQA